MIEDINEFNKKYQLKYIYINNAKWEYLSKGSGKITLLVIPGGGQYAQSQYQMIDNFSDKYKVIIPTIYGVYSLEDCFKGIDEMLKKEKAEKLIVYGLSIGALIAQSYTKRNLNRVIALIISHGCAPASPTYKKKVIRSLQLLNFIMPIVSSPVIKFFSKNFAGRIQGSSKSLENNNSMNLLSKNFYDKYLNKTLLYTWINLHLDFFKNEKFDSGTFEDWEGKALILRTDNDPLMQDDGEFKNIYPKAIVKTFTGTGHLTDIYRKEEIIKTIKYFLK